MGQEAPGTRSSYAGLDRRQEDEQMSLAGGIAIFGLIWFLVLFAVLPFGVRTSAEAGDSSCAKFS